MARKKGSISKTDNTKVREILLEIQSANEENGSVFYTMPSWINDSVNAALNQVPQFSDKRINPYRIFVALRTIDELSVVTVGEFFNRRKNAIDGKDYSKSWISYLTRVCRSASLIINLHSRRYHTKDGVEWQPTTVTGLETLTEEAKSYLFAIRLACKENSYFYTRKYVEDWLERCKDPDEETNYHLWFRKHSLGDKRFICVDAMIYEVDPETGEIYEYEPSLVEEKKAKIKQIMNTISGMMGDFG